MRSLLRIIKPDRAVYTGDVVYIPDTLAEPFRDILDEEMGGAGEIEPASAPLIDREMLLSREADLLESARAKAEAESQRIIQRAMQERERMIAAATAEADTIRQQAHREGYEAGRASISERVENYMAGIDQTIKAMQTGQESFFTSYEQELKYLAVDIAERILARSIEADEMAMTDLVRQAVASVKGSDWITVELPDRMTELVSVLAQEFALQMPSRQVEVTGRSHPDGTCIIRTSSGVVDASVSEQLQNLRATFEEMDNID